MSLPVIGLDQIRAVATPSLVLPAVRDALIAHAEGRIQLPAPAHLCFPDAPGDCHVKAGYVNGSSRFAIKVATGFYGNPRTGMPVNNGLMLVLDATTGVPLAVLADDGWLTAWRTAAAGALIGHALTRPDITQAAVLGTGLQARLQIEWLHALRPLTRVRDAGHRPPGGCARTSTRQGSAPARPAWQTPPRPDASSARPPQRHLSPRQRPSAPPITSPPSAPTCPARTSSRRSCSRRRA